MSSSSHHVPRPGEIFEERYELLEILGTGGMGTVFKAKQRETGRLIALKVLHTMAEEQSDDKERFLREARALSVLSHPNVVTVYHLGVSADNSPFIAMELIKGKTLRKLLSNESKLEPLRAAKIILQCCSALSAMHQAGIVHRDLKPENIVLLDEISPEQVKIIDFGLVHLLNSEQKLTATGILIGSVNYMSPEQCKGLPPGIQSDIYSMTVCLFELLSGRPPFEADSPVGAMYKHSHEAVPPLNLELAYADELDEFIKKGMAKDPEKRFSSAEAMIAELNRIIDIACGANNELTFELKLRKFVRKQHQGMLASLVILLGIVSVLLLASVLSRTQHQHSAFEKKLIEPKYSDPILKAEHLMRSAELNMGTPEGLRSAEEAYKIALADPRRARTSNLKERVMYVLSRGYESAGRVKDALPVFLELSRLDHKTVSEMSGDFTWQDALSSRAHLACCYMHLGEEAKAREIAAQIIATEDFLRTGAAEQLMHVFLNFHDDNSATRTIGVAADTDCLIKLFETCRSFKRDDLAELCLIRARKVKAAEAFNKYPDEIYNLDICESELFLDRHKPEKAKVILERLYVMNWHREEEDRLLLNRFAKCLKAVNRLNEAEKVLPASKITNKFLALSRADVLVSIGNLKEAQNLIDKYNIGEQLVIDPETGKDSTVLEQMTKINSGKANHKLGLDSFH